MSKHNNATALPEPDTLSALRELEKALAARSGGKCGPGPAKDPVTALLPHKEFLNRLNGEINRAYSQRRPLSLALFNLPGLNAMKREEGEMLLRSLASRIWDSAQTEDVGGRLEGDLLALILPGSGHFHALALAESVVNDVWKQCDRLGLELFPLKASVAAPLLKNTASDRLPPATELLDNAQQALKQACSGPEAQVRDRVKLYRKEETPEERETLVLANEKQFLFFGGV